MPDTDAKLLVYSLKKQYVQFRTELGQTGAGLRAEEVEPGSNIANKISTL